MPVCKTTVPVEGKVQRYVAVSFLGVGAFGMVFLVKSAETGELIALKILCPEDSELENVIERECEPMEKPENRHANVMQVFRHYVLDGPTAYGVIIKWLGQTDFCMPQLPVAQQITFDGLLVQLTKPGRLALCIEMEPCGPTLRNWLDTHLELNDSEGPSFQQTTLHMLCNLIAGMQFLHSRNIVHRDLTPQNIFFSLGNPWPDVNSVIFKFPIKIGDFGLCKEVAGEQSVTASHPQAFSRLYRAKEATFILKGNDSLRYGKNADWYSVGLILYEVFYPTPLVQLGAAFDALVANQQFLFQPRFHSTHVNMKKINAIIIGLTRTESKDRKPTINRLSGIISSFHPVRDNFSTLSCTAESGQQYISSGSSSEEQEDMEVDNEDWKMHLDLYSGMLQWALEKLDKWFKEIKELVANQKPQSFERLTEKYISNEKEKDEAIKLAQTFLTKAHPDAVSVINRLISVIQSRWDEISSWTVQRTKRLKPHLLAYRGLEDIIDEVTPWLQMCEDHVVQFEFEPLPDDLDKIIVLIEDHGVFMERMALNKPKLDAVCNIKPIGRERQFKCKLGTGLKFVTSGKTNHAEAQMKNPRAKALWDKWKVVRTMAWERKRRLEAKRKTLQQLDMVKNFSWDLWRKRFLKFANHQKIRILDMFRNMNKSCNTIISREEFVDAIIKSKFPTNHLELNTVVDMLHYCDTVNYMEFVAKLRADWNDRNPVATSGAIDDEVKKQVMKCSCRQKFIVIKVADGKYRFGASQKLILVRVLRSTVLLRVGGGWITLDDFLLKNDQCRGKRTNVELPKQITTADVVSKTTTLKGTRSVQSLPTSPRTLTTYRFDRYESRTPLRRASSLNNFTAEEYEDQCRVTPTPFNSSSSLNSNTGEVGISYLKNSPSSTHCHTCPPTKPTIIGCGEKLRTRIPVRLADGKNQVSARRYEDHCGYVTPVSTVSTPPFSLNSRNEELHKKRSRSSTPPRYEPDKATLGRPSKPQYSFRSSSTDQYDSRIPVRQVGSLNNVTIEHLRRSHISMQTNIAEPRNQYSKRSRSTTPPRLSIKTKATFNRPDVNSANRNNLTSCDQYRSRIPVRRASSLTNVTTRGNDYNVRVANGRPPPSKPPFSLNVNTGVSGGKNFKRLRSPTPPRRTPPTPHPLINRSGSQVSVSYRAGSTSSDYRGSRIPVLQACSINSGATGLYKGHIERHPTPTPSKPPFSLNTNTRGFDGPYNKRFRLSTPYHAVPIKDTIGRTTIKPLNQTGPSLSHKGDHPLCNLFMPSNMSKSSCPAFMIRINSGPGPVHSPGPMHHCPLPFPESKGMRNSSGVVSVFN